MKTIAKVLMVSIGCFMALATTNRDCIWEFHLAVVQVQETYESTADGCASAPFPRHCFEDALMEYEHGITVAVNNYDDCMAG